MADNNPDNNNYVMRNTMGASGSFIKAQLVDDNREQPRLPRSIIEGLQDGSRTFPEMLRFMLTQYIAAAINDSEWTDETAAAELNCDKADIAYVKMYATMVNIRPNLTTDDLLAMADALHIRLRVIIEGPDTDSRGNWLTSKVRADNPWKL